MKNQEVYRVVILARIGEIALKGLNRGRFEQQLIQNLKYRLKSLGKFRIFQSQSRLWIEPLEETDAETNGQSIDLADSDVANKILTAVTQVFGIVSASLVRKFDGDIEEIQRQSLAFVKNLLDKHPNYKTFKVESKRSDKSFPFNSPQICHAVGGHVLSQTPALSVNVNSPDFILYVEVREHMYVYSEKILGHRGLPVGTAGRAMLLLSGGIDSPVAGYMMASRGMTLEAIYFHSHPYTSEQAKEKVIELARILSGFSGTLTLHIVNFTDIQLELYRNTPQTMLTITMRRVMMQIAERLAQKNNCKALITGESLGQVASQTLEALCLTNQSVAMPVFRPLIGLDKEEAVVLARRIGTFETSILPYEDCCTVFVAKHPKTHPTVANMIAAEQNIDMAALVQKGLDSIESIKI